MVVPSRQRSADQVVAQRLPPMQQQVVEVEQPQAALAGDVGLAHRADGVDLIDGPRRDRRDDVADRRAGVHRPGVDVQQRGLARDPADGGAALQDLVPYDVHHIGGVRRVEHREALGQPEPGGVLPQRAVGHGVERAAGDPARPVPRTRQAGVAAVHHLPRRPAGERQQQHPLGGRAVGDQPCHAAGERRGLARPGAGQHPQRPAVEPRHRQLLLVQPGEQILCVHAFDPRAGASARVADAPELSRSPWTLVRRRARRIPTRRISADDQGRQQPLQVLCPAQPPNIQAPEHQRR